MSTREEFEREAESAAEKLEEASRAARDHAEEAAAEARRAASAYAAEGQRAAADALHDYAAAVRRAGEELEARDRPVGASLTSQAADGLDHVAADVATTSMRQMVDSVHRFARHNPGVFILGSVLAGVALGRFAKASSERVDHPDDCEGAGDAVSPARPVAGASSNPPTE